MGGKLQKGGDPDLDTAARIVLYDWQRGRIPYFSMPPMEDDAGKAVSSSSSGGSGKTPDGAEVTGSAAAEERGPNGDQGTSSSAIVVRQDLAELSCSLEYDNADMRGEEPGAAASKETAEGNSSDRNKKTML